MDFTKTLNEIRLLHSRAHIEKLRRLTRDFPKYILAARANAESVKIPKRHKDVHILDKKYLATIKMLFLQPKLRRRIGPEIGFRSLLPTASFQVGFTAEMIAPHIIDYFDEENIGHDIAFFAENAIQIDFINNYMISDKYILKNGEAFEGIGIEYSWKDKAVSENVKSDYNDVHDFICDTFTIFTDAYCFLGIISMMTKSPGLEYAFNDAWQWENPPTMYDDPKRQLTTLKLFNHCASSILLEKWTGVDVETWYWNERFLLLLVADLAKDSEKVRSVLLKQKEIQAFIDRMKYLGQIDDKLERKIEYSKDKNGLYGEKVYWLIQRSLTKSRSKKRKIWEEIGSETFTAKARVVECLVCCAHLV